MTLKNVNCGVMLAIREVWKQYLDKGMNLEEEAHI